MNNKQFSEQERQTLEEIMSHRRDVRGNNFQTRELPDDVFNSILQAAALAPSVGFSQPWDFVVIKEQAIKQKVANIFAIENQKAESLFDDDKKKLYSKLKLEGILEAPINLAVFYKPSEKPVLGQTSMTEMGEYSVACAVQNMWLMARSLNVGIGWVSILQPEAVKELVKAPSHYKLVAYLCIGYVKTFYDTPELERLQWEKRKSIQQAVHLNSFDN